MLAQTVPNWLTGVWKRLSIEENGSRDTTTQVTWLQTSSSFADIRIPAHRPIIRPTVRCKEASPRWSASHWLSSLSSEQAIALSQQEGFAGIARFANNLCEWHRALDYAPFTGEPDRGTLHWEGDILIETGPNHSYKEEWQRIATGPTAALTTTHSATWKQWLVICGDYFIYMCDRRQHLPANTTLQKLLYPDPNAELNSASLQYLNCEISLGRISTDRIDWKIQQSTFPWKEGTTLWNIQELHLDMNNIIVQTDRDSQTTWEIQECGHLEQLLSKQPAEPVLYQY